MKTKRIAGLVAALALASIAYSQTAAELMQKGIYTQETAGDLNGAINIYRQIVNSGTSPRDLAAQAQYRLAQSLLQKGDLGNAAQEFDKLARSYADYGKLVSSMAAQATQRIDLANTAAFLAGLTPEQMSADHAKELQAKVRALEVARASAAARPGGRAGDLPLDKLDSNQMADVAKALQLQIQALKALAAGGIQFDSNPVTVQGVAIRMELMNPSGTITVASKEQPSKRYTFATAAPEETRRQGWTRDAVHPGDEVTITGLIAGGGKTMPDGSIAGSATTVTGPDGRRIFDRSTIQK